MSLLIKYQFLITLTMKNRLIKSMMYPLKKIVINIVILIIDEEWQKLQKG